jgi:hypothetical protein
VPHDRSSDRQPTYRQGADGTGSNGHGPDCGRPKASRCQLHRCTLLPAAAKHELGLFCCIRGSGGRRPCLCLWPDSVRWESAREGG